MNDPLYEDPNTPPCTPLVATLCRAITEEERILDKMVEATEAGNNDLVLQLARDLAELRKATMTNPDEEA